MNESKLYKPMTIRKDPKGLYLRIRWEADHAVMALIPEGEFLMGSLATENSARGVTGVSRGESPQHKVYLDAYYIDETEITVAQYRRFSQAAGTTMRAQPAWSADNHPVVNVSWRDAKAYCDWAGKRLPTEAEWEKAARGGANTKFCCGDDEAGLGSYCWYQKNAGGQSHPVGTKKSNQYGLHDMHGNVSEWVNDWHELDYYRISPSRNPQGPSPSHDKVWRGGSWQFEACDCRSASRNCSSEENWYAFGGFRCAVNAKR